jgi:hypothetical protein
MLRATGLAAALPPWLVALLAVSFAVVGWLAWSFRAAWLPLSPVLVAWSLLGWACWAEDNEGYPPEIRTVGDWTFGWIVLSIAFPMALATCTGAW